MGNQMTCWSLQDQDVFDVYGVAKEVQRGGA